MEAFAGSAILLLVGVSTVVGIRLLARWRHGGDHPELLLGLMLLLTVGVGYPTMIGADRTQGDLARGLFLIANASVNVGFSLLFLFTWRVFRAESSGARLLAGAGVASLAVNLGFRVFGMIDGPEIAIAREAPMESVLQMVPVAFAYGWTALESLRYWTMMRRRVRLGLADAAVCNRFLLWGLMSIFVIAGLGLNLSAIVRQVDVFTSPWVMLGSSITGLCQAGLLLLAFLPPVAYLRWLAGEDRGGAPASAAA